MDGFLLIAWVCVGMIVLIALLKSMKIFFDSSSPNPGLMKAMLLSDVLQTQATLADADYQYQQSLLAF